MSDSTGSVLVRCGKCGRTERLPLWGGVLNLDPVSVICEFCSGTPSVGGLQPTVPVTNPPPPKPSTTIHDDYLHQLDIELPDELHVKQEGDYIIRMQRHGDVYHVCTLNRDGQRVGSWLTTTNRDLAEYQIEYLGLNAMMGKETI